MSQDPQATATASDDAPREKSLTLQVSSDRMVTVVARLTREARPLTPVTDSRGALLQMPLDGGYLVVEVHVEDLATSGVIVTGPRGEER